LIGAAADRRGQLEYLRIFWPISGSPFGCIESARESVPEKLPLSDKPAVNWRLKAEWFQSWAETGSP